MRVQTCSAFLTLGLIAGSPVHAGMPVYLAQIAGEASGSMSRATDGITPATALPSQESGAQSLTSEKRQQSAAARRLLEKYYASAYREVGREGLVLLENERDNAELRFAVANSLAWSGYTSEAATQYSMLRGSEYHERAVIGLGHVNRWSGRPDLAAGAYREILAKEPDNREAREGLRLANRELRARTAAIIGYADNSIDSTRVSTALSQKWRDQTGAKIFELRAGRFDEDKDDVRVIQRDLSFRYEDLNAWLAPQIEVSAQQSPHNRLFGAVALKMPGTSAYLSAGRLNWGKLAFDPRALRDDLTANQLGGKVGFGNRLGDFRFDYNAYRVSDSNRVQHLNLRLTPSWQPFGTRYVRSFVGLEARKARFNDPRYWSPEEGHYNAFAGLAADWSNDRWETYGSIQYGVPLTDESRRSWSTGFGIKRWLGENWAVNLDIWAMDTPRNGGYQAESATFWIERLW